MARRKRHVRQNETRTDNKRRVSGVPGSAESHLLPGSRERRVMLERQRQKIEEQEQQVRLENQPVKSEEPQREAPDVSAFYDKPMAAAIRKYINFVKKNGLVKKTRAIIEKGLGHKVSRRDFDDELFDPSVNEKTFIREAVADHKGELSDRMTTPTSDTNGDRVVDSEDEAVVTPGMRRMARYM